MKVTTNGTRKKHSCQLYSSGRFKFATGIKHFDIPFRKTWREKKHKKEKKKYIANFGEKDV